MQENDKIFSGNELDDSEFDENRTIQDEKVSTDAINISKRKKRLVLLGVIGLCLIAVTSYIYLTRLFVQREKQPKIMPILTPDIQTLKFHPFVIPLKNDKKYSYMYLSISFIFPEKEIKEEMLKKKYLLRNIIYDLLSEHANQIEWVPALDQLKLLVVKGINDTLSSGKINDLYITRFLMI